MEELKSTKVDWKKITVVGMLVLLSGLVTGGATWCVSDLFHQNELDVKDDEISGLNTRLATLEKGEIENEDETATVREDANAPIKISDFSVVLPSGWTQKAVGNQNTATVTYTGPFVINLIINSEGTDAGMASIQKSYTATVSNNKVSLSGPQTLTMDDLTASTYSLTTTNFNYGGKSYYAYSYLDNQSDQNKYAAIFKQVLESLKFN
jgi:hypothetical protein